jgi:cell division protein FtsI (penicillin-binding protein 3)
MVKPRFINQVKQFDQVIEQFNTEIISESICSIETINVVKNMMKNVVEKKHGTAHNIYSEDFSMAGKTGTCQTEYWKSSGLYISSFAGYFPADKPKYSCIVVIHKPNKSKGYYGNVVAAPVFKEIAQKIYSEIPSVEIFNRDGFDWKSKSIDSEVLTQLENMIMPDLSDYELMDVIPLLENIGCKVLVEGYGNKIRQSVRAGSTINKGQTIKIKLI